jgi:hypothetical protein
MQFPEVVLELVPGELKTIEPFHTWNQPGCLLAILASTQIAMKGIS